MRNYLKDVEIVGATMVYQEGDQCRWSLDWLYANCDRVCILLDNWNEETEKIVLEYRDKYPDITHISYSDEDVRINKNEIQGQIKKRFKLRQDAIRERMIIELKKMHDEKPIDLLIWPDSDETFIDEFPKYLEEFWNQDYYEFMMLGFVEVYDSFRMIISHQMAPHGRVYKYKPEMTVYPWRARTRYNPYYNEKRPWKVRNVIVHMNHFTEDYRERREFFSNVDMMTECIRYLWFLPKDVRKMTAQEIADYQPGHRQAPSKYKPILLSEYIKEKNMSLSNN
jgi:hypothetical protein